MSAQFLMKSGKVAFTTDIETLIISQRGKVETAIPANKLKEERKLSRLLKLRDR